MAYTFHLDHDNAILLARFSGHVTDELLRDFHHFGGRRTFASLQFRGSITDFSDVTSFNVTAETIRILAWEPPIEPDPLRPRVIVAPEPHVYGLCRIFASHGEDTRPSLHIVRSLEHAHAILGVVSLRFEPIAVLPAD